MNTRKKEASLTLEILNAIEQRSDLTQRHLARRMNVALGLANSYLRRCVRKGLVKIHQAPANRYLYYLTPKGFAEKGRLTAEYLSSSFAFYRKAGESCTEAFDACRREGRDRVVLCGVSELAEIASLRAGERDVAIVGVHDPDSGLREFLGRKVEAVLSSCEPFDVAMLTDLGNPLRTLEGLKTQLSPERIVVPDIFGLAVED